MSIRRIAFSAVTLAFVTVSGQAASVTYIETITASGSLGGTSFRNALVTITAIADTKNVMGVPLFPNVRAVDDDSATIDIAGLGTATFTGSGTHVFVAQATPFSTGAVGIAAGTIASPEADILDIVNPAFGTYGLTTSIGPLSGAASGGGGGAFSFATSSGPLFFDSFFGTDGTFQAIVVPEPPSLALAGIASASGIRRTMDTGRSACTRSTKKEILTRVRDRWSREASPGISKNCGPFSIASTDRAGMPSVTVERKALTFGLKETTRTTMSFSGCCRASPITSSLGRSLKSGR